MYAPINPLLTDEPVTDLDTTPSVQRALRQCGAKTIGDAHAALTSGRFANCVGVGPQREQALADAIAFKGADLARRAKTRDLARRALDELNQLDEPLRAFASNARTQHAPAMLAALRALLDMEETLRWQAFTDFTPFDEARALIARIDATKETLP